SLKLRPAGKHKMIREGKSPEEKLKLVKEIGFEGVELECPNSLDRREILKASDSTGIKIHGVITGGHWKHRLSDPDPKVRAQGLEARKGAIADAKFYGADTVLLVPGKVTNPETENFDQV